MIAICICLAIIGSLYLLLIGFILYGWFRTQTFISQDRIEQPYLTVIIPVRNESAALSDLLLDLSKQDYPKEKFEIIIADDHSDCLPDKIIAEISRTSGIRILHLNKNESGKQAALRKALLAAKSELVLITDADCRIQYEWISEMANYYICKEVLLMFGNVKLRDSRKIFDWFQSLEFTSLVASGAGFAGAGYPILCNAANMGFKKSTYLQFLHEKENHLPVSGDDIMFLLWLKKKYPDRIGFVKSLKAQVETNPAPGIKGFIQQRLRWTSKSRYYRDFMIIMTSIVVYFTSFFLLIMLAGSFFSVFMMKGFICLFLLKCITDFILLFVYTSYYRSRYLLAVFIPLEIIYFVYISLIGFAGNLSGFIWKDRKIKH